MKGKSSRNNRQDNLNQDVSPALPEPSPAEGYGLGKHGQEGREKDSHDNPEILYKLKPSLSKLVKNTDGFLKIDEIKEIGVILKKCCCKSVWCPSCWEYFYIPKLRGFLEDMDYRHVRHITPTIARDQFNDLGEAYHLFNAGEFVNRLTRGKRIREGTTWTDKYLFEPIKWHSWLWFVEFHMDGTAHFHLVLEVEKIGREGMIGGDRLRHYWPYGRINETFFKTEKHWIDFMGYGVKTSYASKDKAHQGVLPELLDQVGSKKIRRWGHSRDQKEQTDDNFAELCSYFQRKGMELKDVKKPLDGDPMKAKRNKKRSYGVILQECGSQTFAKLSIGKTLFKVLLNAPYRDLAKNIDGKYVEKKGYVGSITIDEYLKLISHLSRVISAERINYTGTRDYIKRRSAAIDKMAAVIGDKWQPKNRRPFTW